jgi:cell wall-associated NlpC family hydrolase
MPDGRRNHHARAAAVILTTLTTVGLGLATASPAAATPDTNDIDAAQARVDRLSQKADAAQKRHDSAETTLTGARRQRERLSTGIHHQRRLMDSVRAKLASAVVAQYDGADEYDGTAGSSAPSRALPTDSEVMLTNVTVVSEDTGKRGDALTHSNAQVGQLSDRRTAVRHQITKLRGLEKSMGDQQSKVDSRAAKASAVLDDLAAEAEQKRMAAEQKRMAALGGPAVAYAKSQVGKAYVYGAAGPSSFDCSGLMMAAWSQAGVSLPHSSSAQYSAGQHISESELQPGDLVFYYSPISHVGMYIGGGKIVNALNPSSGVQVSGLHDMPYAGAARVG